MQPGQRVAQYEIRQKLGSGGMGVVYSAHDHRLDRSVALKFLPPAWSQDAEAKARFMREARAASGLDHPNIYTIYEIGETDDGSLFIVTPFYDGRTLKYRLENRPLPFGDVRSIVQQLLEALAAAHKAGIIHRDVKPANVMVTNSGAVKLLDFGLAKLTADVQITREGTTLGTTAYMSPEQASGRPVDHRSDLWSVGVILYEMLTGKRPFEGDYEQAVIYSVLNQNPVPVESIRPDAPHDLVQTVRRLLEKSPQDRFDSADAVLRALESDVVPVVSAAPSRRIPGSMIGVAIAAFVVLIVFGVWFFGQERASDNTPIQSATPTTGASRSSIAVMPFSNLNSDPETDFLGFALADQIIGSLSYVNELLVRPSSSIRPYVDRTYSTRSAGQELAVDYLLNGAYQRQADEMRLTIELVDVSSDQIIWREPVQLKYENAFQIQDAVSQKVLRRLEVEFSSTEHERMTHDVPSDPLAYDYYLQAISYPETEEGTELALKMLRSSIELDSSYAPAWNDLGFRLSRLGTFALKGRDPVVEAEHAFLKALDLNSSLLSTLGNLSSLYTETGRMLDGIRLADRMLEINPASALGHFARGYGLRYAGLTRESVEEMNQAIRLDSTDHRFRGSMITYVTAGDLDGAERVARIVEGSAYALAWLGEVMMRRGRYREATRYLAEAVRKDPDGQMGVWASGIKSAYEGNHEAGLEAARRWEESGVPDVESHYFNAGIYCLNGDVDSCIRLLRKAVNGGYLAIDLLERDRFSAPARSDPRFAEILALAREKQAAFKREYGDIADRKIADR